MLTINDCLQTISIERAALFITTKVAFDRSKGYIQSLDNQTFWEFARKMDSRLCKINKQLITGEYQFGPCKEITRIRSGKERKIYISTWSDRIVERWLSTAINYQLNGYFSQSAFAYRRQSLGIDACQYKIATALRSNKYFIQRDISKYFYSINHDILLAQLSKLVDTKLLALLEQRIKFQYDSGEGLKSAILGLPFGTPIACVLSNIYLTDLDKQMGELPVRYFRYADDYLIVSDSPKRAMEAADTLDIGLASLQLKTKLSHSNNLTFTQEPGFTTVTKLRYLGLEFRPNKVVRLPIEKQRKIINFFKRGIAAEASVIKKAPDRLVAVVDIANKVVEKRIRSVAIIDYYLKHITDEHQLSCMDRIIAELVISTVTGRPFRKGHFRKYPYSRLRQLGLVSLVHRSRLLRCNKLRVPFLTMFDSLMLERYESAVERNLIRIQRVKMSRKLKNLDCSRKDMVV